MYAKLSETAKFIQIKLKKTPTIGLVLGSGLGSFVDNIEDQIIIPYSDIPHFPQTTVEGHSGRLILGHIKGVQVAVLQGRLHAYEGYKMEEVVFPIRVLATLGVEKLILTNASGGINKDFNTGDLVIIKDHINFMGQNPLVGKNINELGPRFPDMTEAYDNKLSNVLKVAMKEEGRAIKTGIYVGVLGPTYETPAEINMFRVIGADMVGMSTVPECIAANHLGLKVCGISCITNMAAGIEKGKLNHEDVKIEASKVMENFNNILLKAIPTL